MTRIAYQDELHRLRDAVVDELRAVSEQLGLVLEALAGRDVVDEIIARDEGVDRRYAELQNDLIAVIARQAPVASDLRLIAALMHISRMAERMGDQCVNIAKLLPVAGPLPADGETFQGCVVQMGRHALDAVDRVTLALKHWDVELADTLAERDQEVNELNRTCFTRAIELGTSEPARTWATAMILVARALERIGDNAVDIGAHMRFVTTGSHQPASTV